ncbi:hypothetical protein QVN85_10250 [Oscillibacter valericigenes]|nr:hypothetical protein [Oscillibacter valericigenes]
MKPVLFNTEMTQAIMAGRKNTTRRVIKPQPKSPIVRQPDGSFREIMPCANGVRVFVPRFKVGDVLYIRETWQFIPCRDCGPELCSEVPTVFEDKESTSKGCFIYRANYPEAMYVKWKPSIFMPRQAARTFLRVIDARVEQLQDIDAQGIRKEGLASMAAHAGDMRIAIAEWQLVWDRTMTRAARALYGWEANPWIWVYEFQKISKAEAQK